MSIRRLRIWNRPAAPANRARAFRRRTEQPSRRDRALSLDTVAPAFLCCTGSGVLAKLIQVNKQPCTPVRVFREHSRCAGQEMGEKSRGVLDAADEWLAAIETQDLFGATPSLEQEF